ncbi:MAG: hypothetical protein M3Q27_03470 [Actinomycetota bacterium]|nr:hypothetical protein [Actinomycetota bacterium]
MGAGTPIWRTMTSPIDTSFFVGGLERREIVLVPYDVPYDPGGRANCEAQGAAHRGCAHGG